MHRESVWVRKFKLQCAVEFAVHDLLAV